MIVPDGHSFLVFSSGGSKGRTRRPKGSQLLRFDIQILRNAAMSGDDTPTLRGWRPLLREILDPPLFSKNTLLYM